MLLCVRIEKPGSNSSGILIPPLGKLPFESRKKTESPPFYIHSTAVNLPKSMAVFMYYFFFKYVHIGSLIQVGPKKIIIVSLVSAAQIIFRGTPLWQKTSIIVN